MLTLYNLTAESADAVTNLFPLRLKSRSKMSPSASSNVSRAFPVPMSQMMHVLSLEPVAQISPVYSILQQLI